jgi:hypothetical protein
METVKDEGNSDLTSQEGGWGRERGIERGREGQREKERGRGG